MEKILNFFKRKKRTEVPSQLQKAVKVLKKRGMEYEHLLGSGTFGDVLKVHDSKCNIKKAVKMIHPEKTFEGELLIWPKLNHPNIIPLEKIIRTSKVDLFIMPLHDQALDAILKDKEFQSNPKAFEMSVGWLKDILTALDYLHERKNCHMDLKSNNVLISKDMKAIVCDFSCLNVTNEPVCYGLPTLYRPPEAFQKVKGKTPKLYGIPFDVWSCGMLALGMWTKWYKTQKFHTDSWCEGIYQALFEVLKPARFRRIIQINFDQAHLSYNDVSLALNFLQSTLRYDPSERPTTTKLLQHGLFTREPSKKFAPDLMWTISNEFRDKTTSKDVKSGIKHPLGTTALGTLLPSANQITKLMSKDLKSENGVNDTSHHIMEKTENELPLCMASLGISLPRENHYTNPMSKDIKSKNDCINDVNDASYHIKEGTANKLQLNMIAFSRLLPSVNQDAKVSSTDLKPEKGFNDMSHRIIEEAKNKLPSSMIAKCTSLPSRNQNTNVMSKDKKFKTYSENDVNYASYCIMEGIINELPLSLIALNRLFPSAKQNSNENGVNDMSHRIIEEAENKLPLSTIAKCTSLHSENQSTKVTSKYNKSKNDSELSYRSQDLEELKKVLEAEKFVKRMDDRKDANAVKICTSLKITSNCINDESHRIMEETENKLSLSVAGLGGLLANAKKNPHISPCEEDFLESENKDFTEKLFLQNNNSITHVVGDMHGANIAANELLSNKSLLIEDLCRHDYSKRVEIGEPNIIHLKPNINIKNGIKFLLEDKAHEKCISDVSSELVVLKPQVHWEAEISKEMPKISHDKHLRPVESHQCKSDRIGIKKRIRNWFHEKLSVLTRSKHKKY